MPFMITNPDDAGETREMSLAEFFSLPFKEREKIVRDWMSEAETVELESEAPFQVQYCGKTVKVKKGVASYPMRFAMFLYNKYGPGYEERYGAQIGGVARRVDEVTEKGRGKEGKVKDEVV